MVAAGVEQRVEPARLEQLDVVVDDDRVRADGLGDRQAGVGGTRERRRAVQAHELERKLGAHGRQVRCHAGYRRARRPRRSRERPAPSATARRGSG